MANCERRYADKRSQTFSVVVAVGALSIALMVGSAFFSSEELVADVGEESVSLLQMSYNVDADRHGRQAVDLPTLPSSYENGAFPAADIQSGRGMTSSATDEPMNTLEKLQHASAQLQQASHDPFENGDAGSTPSGQKETPFWSGRSSQPLQTEELRSDWHRVPLDDDGSP
jgi:hypothetical protein